MTLTLVRDLQTQLHHFEKQLLEAGRKKRTSDIGSQSAPETGYSLISFELLQLLEDCPLSVVRFQTS